MANVKENLIKRSLVLNLDDGVTTSGEQKTKARTYSAISENATNEQLLAVGTALGGLMAKDLISVSITKKIELQEED